MNKLIKPLLIILAIVLAVLLQMGFILLILTLLPAVIAYYIDNAPGKPTFKTIVTCNLAGTLSWLMPMAVAASKLNRYDSHELITDVRVWLMAYGAAAVGWCLIYICGFMARFFVAALYEYNAASLEKFQKKLVEEWGDEIMPKR